MSASKTDVPGVPSGTGTSLLGPSSLALVPDAVVGFVGFLHPSLIYTARYGTGLPNTIGTTDDTTVQELSANISLRLAERFTFSYTPTFTWYSGDSYDDRTNHAASLGASAELGSSRLTLGSSYSWSTTPLIETGRQTEQEIWSGGLNVVSPLTDKLNLDSSVGFNSRSAKDFSENRSSSGFLWLRYAKSALLQLSAGFGGTYNSVEPGSDLLSRQVKVGVNWKPAEKIFANFEFGTDFSTFSGKDGKTTTSPVYGLGLGYSPFEQTSLSFSLKRSIGASYFADQLSRATSAGFDVSQRLPGRINLRAGVHWTKDDYVSKAAGIQRSDEIWSYDVQANVQVLQRCSATLFFNKSRNDSTILILSRNTNLVGISLGVQF